MQNLSMKYFPDQNTDHTGGVIKVPKGRQNFQEDNFCCSRKTLQERFACADEFGRLGLHIKTRFFVNFPHKMRGPGGLVGWIVRRVECSRRPREKEHVLRKTREKSRCLNSTDLLILLKRICVFNLNVELREFC